MCLNYIDYLLTIALNTATKAAYI